MSAKLYTLCKNDEPLISLMISKLYYLPFVHFLGLWLVLFLTGSCQPASFADATDAVSSEALAVPVAEYRSVAWVDLDLVTFIYVPEATNNSADDFRTATYTFSTNQWQDITVLPIHSDCNRSFFSDLYRLPDSNLGFTHTCYKEGISGTLYTWNRDTGVVREIRNYPTPSRISQFTFSPSMTELIQEEAVGAGLNNKLYRVRLGSSFGNEMEELFPHFQRARSPSWSPGGQTIAFTGTETYPGNADDLKTWGQIEDLLRYPWDLYLMDADGSNVRIILPKAGRPYQLKWSPVNSELLAFAGDSADDVPGIWILNTETLALVRVWPDNTTYDWSPDGQKMVIIAKEGDGAEHTYPVVIDVPNPEE